jgi:eukaryotic-like serine/threonine-protein kinase
MGRSDDPGKVTPPADQTPQSDAATGLPLDVEATLDPDSSASSPLSGEREKPLQIGPYRLIRKLGEGGMGQVWLAEQSSPLQRQVALKLIRAGLYDESLLQRFQAERQSLAIMSHPAIAKVFDAGATSEGQPYFVMEYVPGLPISDYCDAKKLKIAERLELFVKVCEGVQHAHQKAIAHRDLKPANILVIDIDGVPTPRIIDFGIAKSVLGQPVGETIFTNGGFVGTPGYMSPEQADPSVTDVDTRTDVYSLGVILYVLLTGLLPFDPRQWKDKPFHEVLRHLHEDDPVRPSTKVNSSEAAQTASSRNIEPHELVTLLRGDLDWITMKAIEKDRARRYGTPSELASDIQRYLSNEPILARPASTGYRLRKYVARHRVAVGVAASLVVLSAAFAVNQAVQLRRITRERDRADRVTDFMSGMFKISDPSEARGTTVTAREILDKASKEIDSGLSKDPELQTKMMDTMGSVYRNLGLYSQSQALLSRSLDIKRSVLGPRNRETLFTANRLASTLADAGHLAEAEKLLRATVEEQRRVLGPENRDTLGSMNNLATVLEEQGHFVDAEKLQSQIIEIQSRILGPEHPETLTSMSNLALELSRQEGQANYAKAEELDRRVLEARSRILGAEHPDTLRSMGNLAVLMGDEGGHNAEVEALLRKVIEIRRRIVGPEHPDTLGSLGALGEALDQAGRLAEAEQLYRDLLETERRVLGATHPATLRVMIDLTATLHHEKKLAEAEKLERETIGLYKEKFGTQHPETLVAMVNLAATLQDEGKLVEAEKMERDSLELAHKVLGPQHQAISVLMYNLATILEKEGHLSEAEKMMRETIEFDRHAYRPGDSRTALAIYALGSILAHAGRREEAVASLREAVDHGLDAGMAAEMEKDPDLKALRGEPQFKALVGEIHQRAIAAPQKP